MANASALDLRPDEPFRNPTGHIAYFFDSTRTLNVRQIAERDAEFRPVERSEVEFGYLDAAVWLRLPIENSGSEPVDRYLLLETNWMESIQVWLTIRGEDQLVLEQTQAMPFATRAVPHQNLAARFSLDAGDSGVLWMRYSSRGSTALPINIESELSFVQRSQYQISKATIFYALMLLFITVAFLSYFLFRNAIFPIYVVYASVVLLYVMHRDGFAFQYLWPSFPGWNSFASLPLGVALGISAMLFSRQYLSTGTNYPRIDRLLLGCTLILAIFVPYGLFVDEQGAKQYATIGVFLVAVILLALGLRSWLDRGRRMVFFVAGWFGVVGASLATVLGSVFGAEISRAATLDSIRAAMVFDAIMMGFAMAERVLEIRRERDRALRQQVNTLQSNLNLHERLNKLEARYADAVDATKASGKVLADATHDIRQPLFALRASLRSITENPDDAAVASAGRNLIYLEQLVEEYLEKATSDTASDLPMPNVENPTSVGVVLTAIEDMFAEDAAARGLTFRVRPSQAQMKANPMAVNRIVSNFVGNALRYTKIGGVLVGVRQRDGQPFIVVYDTGPGMDAATLKRVKRRSARGDPSDDLAGKGLGLDIALSLADQHDLMTLVQSSVSQGSCFGVSLSPRPVGPT